jgi:hypothetical protein
MVSRPTESSYVERLIGVARLRLPIYEEIARDPDALAQAALTVLLSAVATNIWVAAFTPRGIVNAVGGIVLAVVAWLLFTAIVVWTGRAGLAARSAPPELSQMLRLTGFATAPSLLNVVGFIPLVGWLVLMIAAVWSLVAAYTAVRVGLRTSERNALAATLIGYVASSLLYLLAAAILGIGRGTLVPLT